MDRVLVRVALAGALLAMGVGLSSGQGYEPAHAIPGPWQDGGMPPQYHNGMPPQYHNGMPPQVPYGYAPARQPWLRVSADAFLLQLDLGTRKAVPVVIAERQSQTRLTTYDLGFDMEFGPRLALEVQLDGNRSLEAVYFGMNYWTSTRQVADDNNLSLPDDLGIATYDFFSADRMTLDYQSDLHNAEANYWQRLGCTDFQLMAGFRHFSLGERFNINSEDIQTGTSDYHVRVRNDLYGAQFGARWETSLWHLGLEFVGKAGVFGNTAGQSTFMGDLDNSIVIRDFNTSRSRAAFIGEAGAIATVQLTQWLTARGGYHVMWLDGVARAPDQLDFTNTTESGSALVFGQGAFLHGATAGLEARW